jgi:hypothetical protein
VRTRAQTNNTLFSRRNPDRVNFDARFVNVLIERQPDQGIQPIRFLPSMPNGGVCDGDPGVRADEIRTRP